MLDPVVHALMPLDEQFEPPMAEERVEDWVRVLSSECNGEVWVTSLGLSRIGIPEIEVVDAPTMLLYRMSPLMKRVAAALFEAL